MASPLNRRQQVLSAIHQFDVATFYWCLRRQHRQGIIEASRWISKTADGPLYLVCSLVLLFQGMTGEFSMLAIAFTIERCCYFVLKNHFKRNRPPAALPNFHSVVTPSDQFSFPSGHTSAAFLMAALLSSFFPSLAVLLYPWALMVGISRVMLGVHFPSDILAGASLGQGLAIAVLSYA